MGLRLPTNMKFASLMDLSLHGITLVEAGSVHLLARLVSSASCPRLHKLRMSHICLLGFEEETMRIEADVLSELSLRSFNVVALELRTPHLHVLHIDRCIQRVFRASAPRLEELMIVYALGHTPRLVEVDGDFPCVRRLKICLWPHRPPRLIGTAEAMNDASTHILKLCNNATCLDVNIDGQKGSKDVEILKSMVPHIPHVTSLTMNVFISISTILHDFGASATPLLTRFINLRCLSIHLSFYRYPFYMGRVQLDLECDHQDHWISNEISMSHLQEVKLTGLIGTDCELWFMKNVFASARGIRKVEINFDPAEYLQHQVKMHMDAFEHMLLNEGMWNSHRDALKLTYHK
ncbi:hypothetical protein BS78_06G110000 [Paspalum vaginatum]|nr:hypothetical protein BS78_06G110000 [Paspalum vaginatum]